MLALLLSFFTAFALTYMAIPSIIQIAHDKRLFDEPVGRSSHTVGTPSLGGIAIFAGSIFSFVLWTPLGNFADLQYILCAFIILFLVGARDDILPLSPIYKLGGQFFAALILVFQSDITLHSLYGLFGFTTEMPYWLIVIVSVFTILVIINAFNLIDGINGLAGSIGILVLGTFGIWFMLIGAWGYAAVAFSTVGAVIGFLKYNFTPAKIFMGDTGSLLIGLASSILIIQFIDLNYNLPLSSPYRFNSGPVVAIGIMILPLFDTFRVFVTRIIRGHSPLHPDRRHLHHLLIDYGMGHTRATTLLFFINMLFICFVFWGHDKIGFHVLLLMVVAIAGILTYILHRVVILKTKQRKKEKEKKLLKKKRERKRKHATPKLAHTEVN